MNVIEIRNLSKNYGENQVLHEIELSVKRGSFTALLGINGVGKSTLLNILMDVTSYDCGMVRVLDEDLRIGLGKTKNRIGFVSEDIALNFTSSIKHIIEHAKYAFDKFETEIFYGLMEDRELDVKKNFMQFSRGQRAQIVLNYALSHNAEIIMIDEVTSVLDSGARQFYMDKLNDYCKKLDGTVLLTTNIVSEIEHHASDVIILSYGKVKIACPRQEMPDRFLKIRAFDKTQNPVFMDSKCHWSSRNSDGTSTYLISKEAAAKYNMDGVLKDNRTVTLEEIFVHFANERGEQC